VVQILTKKFDWGLGTILFQGRHIHVINKNNEPINIAKKKRQTNKQQARVTLMITEVFCQIEQTKNL